MRVLLIKPKHIGDMLILTPTIVAIRRAHPAAEIWVMVRRGCEGILAGCPEIDRFVVLAPVEKRDRRASDFWRVVGAMLRTLTVKFDYVFELGDGHRGRLLAKLVRTRRRYSVKTSSGLEGLDRGWFTAMATFEGRRCHRVEKDFYTVSEFLPLPEPIPPLRFASECTRPWEPAAALTDFCVIQMGSRQGFNLWHREGWREVGRGLLDRFEHVVVSCGPAAHEKEAAAWLRGELGPRALDTQGRTSWAQLAGLLYRARLYVGLSSASMHLAAACGCPVVGLFGPAIEDHWHPWRVPYRIVTDPGYVALPDPEERYEQARRRTTEGIRAGDVLDACAELLGR
jgi:heptosyltransferase-3